MTTTALTPALRVALPLARYRQLNWYAHRFFCCSLVELMNRDEPPHLVSAEGDPLHEPLRAEVCDAYDREQIARGATLRAIR